MKNNIESILLHLDQNSSFNILNKSKFKVLKLNNSHNFKFKLGEENLENRNNFNNDGSQELNKDLINKNNLLISNENNSINKKNNNFIMDKVKSRITKKTICNKLDLNGIQLKKSKTLFSNNKKGKLLSKTQIVKINENNCNIDKMYETVSKNKTIIIPKTQLRYIKVPGFCEDFVCKKILLKLLNK